MKPALLLWATLLNPFICIAQNSYKVPTPFASYMETSPPSASTFHRRKSLFTWTTHVIFQVIPSVFRQHKGEDYRKAITTKLRAVCGITLPRQLFGGTKAH